MTIKDTRKKPFKIDSLLKHRILYASIGIIPAMILLYLRFMDIIISDTINVLIMLPYFTLFFYPHQLIGTIDYFHKTKDEKKQDCFTKKFIIAVNVFAISVFLYFGHINKHKLEEQQWNNSIKNHPTLIHRTCGCKKTNNDTPFSDYKIVTIAGDRFIESKNGRYQLNEVEIYKIIK